MVFFIFVWYAASEDQTMNFLTHACYCAAWLSFVTLEKSSPWLQINHDIKIQFEKKLTNRLMFKKHSPSDFHTSSNKVVGGCGPFFSLYSNHYLWKHSNNRLVVSVCDPFSSLYSNHYLWKHSKKRLCGELRLIEFYRYSRFL